MLRYVFSVRVSLPGLRKSGGAARDGLSLSKGGPDARNERLWAEVGPPSEMGRPPRGTLNA